jgi:hypothetical protein
MRTFLSYLNAAAIVMAFASPFCYLVIMLLVLILKLPGGLGAGLFYSPFAFVFAYIAIRRPLAGGILLIIAGGMLFYTSLITHHYPQYYLPTASFSLAGGLLHVARAPRYIPD